MWTIFKPGQIVLWTENGENNLAVLKQATYVEHMGGGKTLYIYCNQIDWDGARFGYQEVVKSIGQFQGSRKVTELEVMPLEHHSQAEFIKPELIKRGQAFEKLQGSHFKAYRGLAAWSNSWGSQVFQQVSTSSQSPIQVQADKVRSTIELLSTHMHTIISSNKRHPC
jgi:hypothetical protein